MQRRLYQPFSRHANRLDHHNFVYWDGILAAMVENVPHGIYIHIPFCLKRCSYCDFNTYVGYQTIIADYVRALEKEIKSVGGNIDKSVMVNTIYFGGGTPSLLSPMNFERILSAINDVFNLTGGMEISFEANPGTLSLTYLKDLYGLGLNRISLGMQTAQPGELGILGRQHTYIDLITAMKWARQASFNNINLDLIFGIPDQTISSWYQSLSLAIDLNPNHFSLYNLNIEPGTPMFRWYSKGLISRADNDLAADMYELAAERLKVAGYIQYEISNWARSIHGKSQGISQPVMEDSMEENPVISENLNPVSACQHNLQYWRNLPYLGFGAGAHGFSSGYRTVNMSSPQNYIQKVLSNCNEEFQPFPQSPANLKMITIDPLTEMQERMIMGLRLTLEGVSCNQFYARFGVSMKAQFKDEIKKNIQCGLLEWVGDRLRLTSKGRLLGNRVFADFV